MLALADESERDENIAIFSHAFSIQYMLTYFNVKKNTLYDLENFTYDRWKFATNTAVTKFSVGRASLDGKRKITFYAIHDDSHVKSKRGNTSHAELAKQLTALDAASREQAN